MSKRRSLSPRMYGRGPTLPLFVAVHTVPVFLDYFLLLRGALSPHLHLQSITITHRRRHSSHCTRRFFLARLKKRQQRSNERNRERNDCIIDTNKVMQFVSYVVCCFVLLFVAVDVDLSAFGVITKQTNEENNRKFTDVDACSWTHSVAILRCIRSICVLHALKTPAQIVIGTAKLPDFCFRLSR